MKGCGLVFVFNSWNSRFPCFFLSTLSALNNFLHNYDFMMIIMRNFSATKESPKWSFHVGISKIPIQKFLFKTEYGYEGLNLCICRSSHILRYSKKILQNLQKNICIKVSFLIKLQASILKLYWRRIWCRFFRKTFEEFLTTIFL